MPQTKQSRIIVLQNIYFYITLAFSLLAVVSLFLGIFVANGAVPKEIVPVRFLETLRILYIYQAVHLVIGIVIFIVLFSARAKKKHDKRLIKVFIALVLTPANFMLLLADVLILAANVLR